MGKENVARRAENNRKHDHSHVRRCHWCSNDVQLTESSTRGTRHFHCGCDKKHA